MEFEISPDLGALGWVVLALIAIVIGSLAILAVQSVRRGRSRDR